MSQPRNKKTGLSLNWNFVHEDFTQRSEEEKTPLGFINNAEINLLHITTNIEPIQESKFLYASGGCLVGSVYCTPLFPIKNNKNAFKMHNLGAYYYEKEALEALKFSLPNESEETLKKKITCLVIKLKRRRFDNDSKLLGVNYLKLGNVHKNIFEKYKYLLSDKEVTDLNEKIDADILNANDFFNECYENNNPSIDITDKLFDDFLSIINNKSLPIFGYIYFEAVCNCIVQFQNDSLSNQYKKCGEIYNWNYKNVMFDLFPDFLGNFKLSSFNPDFEKLCNVISTRNFISSFDKTAFKSSLYKKIVEYTNLYLLDGRYATTDLQRFHNPLKGHLIHRELRSFERYPDFYFYYDQQKALEIWNYWNKNKILIPFNGVMAKGEVGINPAYINNVDYKVYEVAEVTKENNDFIVNLGNVTEITIPPRLVDIKHSFRRVKPTNKSINS